MIYEKTLKHQCFVAICGIGGILIGYTISLLMGWTEPLPMTLDRTLYILAYMVTYILFGSYIHDRYYSDQI